MAANSALRRALKQFLRPLANDRIYRYFQGAAMAWDIRSGSFSEPELDLLPFVVSSGDTALDIGANYGLYSYHLSRAVGKSGRVFAFEPIPFTNRTLRMVARLLRFRNVEIIPRGCGDRAGEVVFSVPVQDSGAICAGLAHIGRRNDDHEGKETQVRWRKTQDVRCELVTVDEVLPLVENLSFIKCDIEGAELFAFRGAEATIDRHRPTILCEINPWYLEGFGIDLRELIGFFSAKGYGLYRYDVRARRLAPVEDVTEITEFNYFFIHPSRSERCELFLSHAMSS